MHKAEHSYKMIALYQMAGISKQGHYKRVAYQKKMTYLKGDLLEAALEVRKRHPRLGCRKLYKEVQPLGLGRDRSEAILLENGFRVSRKRSYFRTTYAAKHWYPNRIHGLEVKDINQLWVSDITYLPLSYMKRFYLTLVMDVYSRRIVGWSLSKTMRARDTVLPAYVMGIKRLSRTACKGLIFHSDKGGQYKSNELEALHQQYGVLPSMGGKAWENAHAESVNGILKNEYINLEGRQVNYSQAYKLVEGVIEKYNVERPHGSINKFKPVEFESYIKQLNMNQKPKVVINY